MPLASIGGVFKGVTPAGARIAYKRLFELGKAKFDRILIPCAGGFSIPEAAIQANVKPDSLVCSDISLYSSVIGYVCDKNKPSLAPLGFKLLDPVLEEEFSGFFTGDKLDDGAAILLVLKYAQLQGQSEFAGWQRKEYLHQKDRLFKQFRSGLAMYEQKLSGLRYEIKDAHEHALEYGDDPTVLLCYNPPGYKGGYGKMYRPYGLYSWASPEVEEIVHEQTNLFLAKLKTKKIKAAIFAEDWYKLPDLKNGGYWLYYNEPYGKHNSRRLNIWLNFPHQDTLMLRSPIKGFPNKFPAVYDDHPITAQSRIEMVECDRQTAHYFYDLFVRELGFVEAIFYYLFLVDGMVAGVCGFDLRFATFKRLPLIYETFGLTMTSLKYPRLNRLMMRYITGREFVDKVAAKHLSPNLFPPKIESLVTTCLSKHPEVKINRGILDLVSREKLPNGRFKLQYQAKLHLLTRQEVLDEWLKKHSEAGKTG